MTIYHLLACCVCYMFFLLFSSGKKESKWILKVPNTRLVREIIDFAGPILHEKKIRHFPQWKIRYYKHKKYMGIYYGYNQYIVIYLHNHTTIPEIVDTVLHEIAHYIQQKTQPEMFSCYDHYTKQYGYNNNPLEVESRAFAKKHCEACLLRLEAKGCIQRC